MSDSDPLRAVVHAARRARAAWRVQRGAEAGLAGLAVGCGLALVACVAREALGGLTPTSFGQALLLLLLGPVAAGLAALRPLSVRAAAGALDDRAELDDRLGAALDFADDAGAMAAWQRQGAAELAVGLKPGSYFRPAWRPGLRRLAPLLLLLLLTAGAALTWDLTPRKEVAAIEEPEDDLLAAIDRERELLLEEEDKVGARLLNDLERRIKRIRAREQEIRRTLQKRAARPEPPPEEPEQVEEAPPEPELADNLITTEDLERLEQQALESMEMTASQEAQVMSDLFRNTRKARTIMENFKKHSQGSQRKADQMSMPSEAGDVSYGDMDGPSSAIDNQLNGNDMLGNSGLSSRMSDIPDYDDEAIEATKNDLGLEGMIEQEREHAMQASFQQFMQDFVKDVQELVAETASGKKKKKEGRDVKTNGGTAVADKADQMAETDFEEVGDQKRQSGDAPAEMAAVKPAEGAPPADAELKPGQGPADGPAVQGQGDGTTEAGAEGAGTGNPDSEDGLAGLGDFARPASGPLEKVLGELNAGRLPPERREQLFDRIARHKVQGGQVSEADDVIVDYFAEAAELMSEHEDELPPLFRDYAHLYFESIRPGGPRETQP